MLNAVEPRENVLSQEQLGQRLASAREKAGLSQSELAEAVGLTQSAISRIESGERSVDSIELSGIARHLGVSVLDLLEEEPLPEELVGVAQRVEAAALPGAVEQAYGRVIELVRFDRLLDQLQIPRAITPRLELPAPSQRLAKDQGRELAEAVRTQLELNDDPIPDLLDVIENQIGLDVGLEPLLDGVEGMCVRLEHFALALVNSRPVVGRRRFTMAHELGHYLAGDVDVDRFHVDETLFDRQPEEIRANAFAAHLLMPEPGLKRWIRGRKVDGRVACELQYTFGVSLESLLWHLWNIGEITEGRRRSLRSVGPKSLAFQHGFVEQWRESEAGRGRVRPPGTLYGRALEAFRRSLIGVERFAMLLGYDDAEELRRDLEDAGITADDWPEDTATA